jgi:hypothetical protein
MGDFVWDSAQSADDNVHCFQEYVNSLYDEGKKLCRCSREMSRAVVPLTDQGTFSHEDRVLLRKSYVSRTVLLKHNKTHGRKGVVGHWLSSDVIRDCVPHLRRKYGAARSSADAPLQQPMRGESTSSVLHTVDPGKPSWFVALIRAAPLICHHSNLGPSH